LFGMRCRIHLALYPRTHAFETLTLALPTVHAIVPQLGRCLALSGVAQSCVDVGGCAASNGGRGAGVMFCEANFTLGIRLECVGGGSRAWGKCLGVKFACSVGFAG
jgi:hypothetical protein